MADSAQLFFEGQPTQADTLLYTAGVTASIVRSIHATNTTGLSATLTLGLNAGGTLGTTTHWLSAFNVLPRDTYDWGGFATIVASGTIRALQGTTGALTVTISGISQ